MDKGAGEKTEKPSGKRIRKARGEGQVPQSQELPSAMIIIAIMLTLWLTGPELLRWIRGELILGINCKTSVFQGPDAFMDFAKARLVGFTLAITPMFLAITVAAIVGSITVTGLNFAPSALKFQLNNISPVKGISNLFSTQALMNLAISVVKLTVLSIVVYIYLRDKMDDLATLRWLGAAEILASIASLVFGILIRLAIAVCIIAAVDVIYQKWKYIHDLKMTRQEVKQERKEEEGSPEIKRKIRTMQFEMAMKRMLQEVPKANVVIVNPTHVAVAIKYDPKMSAPLVVAKGPDHLCEKIKEIARSHGIPIIHRPELARAIFGTVEAGQPIPEALYVAVAEVLAMIYRLRKRL
ncbi:MAG: flagellar biosynthesis protein FlhB [Planctomycetes bacterium GWF2_50_10]|nr:MAG: flagellar biosynthesis protein FlhB [Planctomycetes bacterium GWF2_50_10]